MRRDLIRNCMRPFQESIITGLRNLLPKEGGVDLAQGMPDYDGPEEIRKAAMSAIARGQNQYMSSRGYVGLRNAVAKHIDRFYGMVYRPTDEIVITSGATEGILSTLVAILEPGDEVIFFEPAYEAYAALAAIAGVRVRTVALRPPDWSFSSEDLEKAVTKRTRAFILNYPHNPTGRVFGVAELELIAELCRRNDMLVITDQVYEHFVYEGEYRHFACIEGMRRRTIAVSSTGKTFGLTGWKVGFVCAPAELAEAVRIAHKYIILSSGGPFQVAMAGALTADAGFFRQIRCDMKRRGAFLEDCLRGIGLQPNPVEGGMFLVADVRPLGFRDGIALGRWFAMRAGVVVLPLGPEAPSGSALAPFVRFAFCKRRKTLERAVMQMQEALRRG